MGSSDYLELAVRGAGLSLATYAVIGQVVKPGLRILAKRSSRSGRLTKAKEEMLRWLVRTLCVVVGAMLGSLPVWPAWMTQPTWGVLIGAISGSLSPIVHHAVSAALGERIKKIIGGASVTRHE